MRFDLVPHKGANKLRFGMTKEEVQTILGLPEYSLEQTKLKQEDFEIFYPAKVGYYKNDLQITFDDSGKVDFIEFSGKDSYLIEVYLDNIEIFKTPANQLIKKISDLTNSTFDKTDEEIPFSYVFHSLDLAVWRQVIPALDEKSEEIPDSDQGKYFWTIGIGIDGYFMKK